jgi:hypothetical protein
MWGLWFTKGHWSRFSPSTSVSPANHHSTNFSIIIITRGWHNRPISGCSATVPPPTKPIKKIENKMSAQKERAKKEDRKGRIINKKKKPTKNDA